MAVVVGKKEINILPENRNQKAGLSGSAFFFIARDGSIPQIDCRKKVH
jgi:hypothetical protein